MQQFEFFVFFFTILTFLYRAYHAIICSLLLLDPRLHSRYDKSLKTLHNMWKQNSSVEARIKFYKKELNSSENFYQRNMYLLKKIITFINLKESHKINKLCNKSLPRLTSCMHVHPRYLENVSDHATVYKLKIMFLHVSPTKNRKSLF